MLSFVISMFCLLSGWINVLSTQINMTIFYGLSVLGKINVSRNGGSYLWAHDIFWLWFFWSRRRTRVLTARSENWLNIRDNFGKVGVHRICGTQQLVQISTVSRCAICFGATQMRCWPCARTAVSFGREGDTTVLRSVVYVIVVCVCEADKREYFGNSSEL